MVQSPRSHSRFYPRVERLESRYAMDAGGVQLDLDLGDLDPGIDPSEFTVSGISSTVFDGQVVTLPDGGHVFFYMTEAGGLAQIFGRATTADGTPGGPAQFVLEVDLGNSSIDDMRYAVDDLADGGFMMVWTDSGDLLSQRFNADYSPTGTQLTLASLSAAGAQFHDVAVRVLADNTALVAYVDSESEMLRTLEIDSQGSTFTQLWQDNSTREPSESPAIYLDFSDYSAEPQLTWLTQNANTPLQWDLHVVELDEQSSFPQSEWRVDSFVSAPEFAYFENDTLLVTGVQAVAGDTIAVANLLNSDLTPIAENILDLDSILIGDMRSLAIMDDGSFTIGYLSQVADTTSMQLQNFNRDAQPIGNLVTFNQSPLYVDPHATLARLSTGGFVGYWLGYALDGQTPAVLTRSLELDALPLEVELQDPNGLFDNSSVLRVSNLPADLGLSVGKRIDATTWDVPILSLDELEILGTSETTSLSLSLQLLSSAGDQVSLNSLLGTDFADSLRPYGTTDLVLGRNGFDTLVMNGISSDHSLVQLSEDRYRLLSANQAVDLAIEDVESFRFDDALLSLNELLSGPENPPDEPPPPPQDNGGGSSLPPIGPPPTPGSGQPNPPPPSKFGPGHGNPGPKPEWNGQTESRTKSRKITEHKSRRSDDDSAERTSVGQESKPVSKSAKSAAADEAQAPGLPPIQVVTPTDALSRVLDTMSTPLENKQASTAFVPITSTQPTYASPALGLTMVHATNITMPQNTAPAPGAPTLADIPEPAQPVFPNADLVVAPEFDSELLFAQVDEIEQEIVPQLDTAQIVVGSAVILATGFSVANLGWLLRGSLLLTKLLTSMPIWLAFDPLPLLAGGKAGNVNRCHESLADIAGNQ